MILLDTHIWIWWIDENPKLSPQNLEIIKTHQASGLGVSIISCWEIAKLVEKGRLTIEVFCRTIADTCPKLPWCSIARVKPTHYYTIDSTFWISCRSC